MGYCISLNEAEFHIAADKTAGALTAIRELMGAPDATRCGGSSDGRVWFSWMNNANPDAWQTLADAMDDWRYPIEMDADGNVVDISFEGEKIGEEDQMFRAIAPFVTAGSYVGMLGEEGAHWRWYFDGETMVEQAGKVTYS